MRSSASTQWRTRRRCCCSWPITVGTRRQHVSEDIPVSFNVKKKQKKTRLQVFGRVDWLSWSCAGMNAPGWALIPEERKGGRAGGEDVGHDLRWAVTSSCPDSTRNKHYWYGKRTNTQNPTLVNTPLFDGIFCVVCVCVYLSVHVCARGYMFASGDLCVMLTGRRVFVFSRLVHRWQRCF